MKFLLNLQELYCKILRNILFKLFFSGVPAVVDIAALRDVVKDLGQDPSIINPIIPTELVIDHSVQVDFFGTKDAKEKNEEMEFKRNKERFQFLRWGQRNLKNFLIVPPGSGIVHQVNLEYLARVVFSEGEGGFLYPDSLVGTDSHTTMINGLGVLGWGVGGIEAESAMLGQVISMVLPKVVGVKLTKELPDRCNATDLVLTVTERLRKRGVVGQFVEFFGDGINTLSLSDRATIANMAPEYGATMGFFAVDENALGYLRTTGRAEAHIKIVESYLKTNKLFRNYNNEDENVNYSGEVMEVDLSKIVPTCAGPKRPHDRIELSELKNDFIKALPTKLGFKGFGVSQDNLNKNAEVNFKGENYSLEHGSVVIAAITSCTNTSNPEVMLAAGLLAKKAVERGLKVKPYVKTSLSPGSGVAAQYLDISGTLPYLERLGFNIAGYGCMTCIGNSGDLPQEVADVIVKEDLVSVSVLSGNRNFEGRVHNQVKANYLASPPLVVAYALAGNVKIDLETEPLGYDHENKPVYLKEIWPSKKEIQNIAESSITPKLYEDVYSKITQGTETWNSLEVKDSVLYDWDENSTYIKRPPFFDDMYNKEKKLETAPIKNANVLLSFGDSITTDHISPAGNISKNSAAAK